MTVAPGTPVDIQGLTIRVYTSHIYWSFTEVLIFSLLSFVTGKKKNWWKRSKLRKKNGLGVWQKRYCDHCWWVGWF